MPVSQPLNVSAPQIAGTDAKDRLNEQSIVDEAILKSELKRRRDRNIYKSVHPADVEAQVAAGWQVHREGKTVWRLFKPKTHDVWLEDRAWCLLRLMRYPEMNGKRFRISYKRKDGSEDSKQIDVFAKDDETALIIECKSKVSRGKRILTKDLSETQSLQNPIRDAIKAIYGKDSKIQCIFIYVTENIIWSEPDLERAQAANIKIITENEFRYYSKFIKHLGPAGRYQFLAELLPGKKVAGLEGIKVPAVRGKFGKNTFYSFVISARHLLKIAFVNHQALNHPDGSPAYQRMIQPSRIKEIGDFIEAGGFFPTNILINFTGGCNFTLLPKEFNASENLKFGMLQLPATYKSAWIIDGQHRLYGFSRISERKLDQSLFVLAFDQMETKEEADLFITINNKQKSVPPAILTSLKADLNWGSENPKERIEALASMLVKSLNIDPTSPFAQRFAMEGLEGAEEAPVTIGEVSKGLVRSQLLGRMVLKGYALGPLSGATDLDTIKRARRVLNGYFGQIRSTNETRWEAGKAGFILNNPGIRAHLLLLADVIRFIAVENHIEPEQLDETELLEQITPIIKPLFDYLKTANNEEIKSKFERKYGEGGVLDYFYTLSSVIQKTTSHFGGTELKKWLAETNQKRKAEANQDIISISEQLNDFVFDMLKKIHGIQDVPGSGEKAYWELGISSANIKAAAYKRQQETPIVERKAREVYVDTIDLISIVKQKNNWDSFKDVLNLPKSGEKGKIYYLDWLEDLNRIRRIPAHPSAQRPYEEADYQFVEWLKQNFLPKLNEARSKII